jgi:tRNA (guanosine-2'-O-)-methyltransferase
MRAAKKAARDIRATRRTRGHHCWGHLIIAPLWVAYQANLGTLLRTCDATGACLAVPDTPHYRRALTVGDSRGVAQRCCIHWIDTGKDRWIRLQRQSGWQILAVELADDAIAPRASPPSTLRPPTRASRSRWWAAAPASTSLSPAAWCSIGSPASPSADRAGPA